MIYLKNPQQIECMRKAGALAVCGKPSNRA